MTSRRRPAVRVLATNDLCCSTSPTRTSFGYLPGYDGLRRCAGQLRDGLPSLWVDAGDFAQGGPLAPLTAGRGGFEAAATLPIDVAVAGNHEFDWGVAHLLEHRDLLPFPLVAANAGGLLPARAVVDLGSFTAAVAGATYPGPGLVPDGVVDPARTTAEVLLSQCQAARQDGADIVIAAVHQGVPFEAGRTSPVAGADLEVLCRALAGTVDLVIGGHTLTRYLHAVHGVPYLQPLSYGYEIGVCDLTADGHALTTVRPAPGAPWNGPGAHLVAAASADVAGHLPAALYSAPGRDRSLPDWIARCIGRAAGAEAALFPGDTLIMQQPPAGGVLGYLPAGAITRADLLRLYPWADDGTVVIDCAGLDVRQLAAALDGPWGDCGTSGITGTPATVCLPGYHLPAVRAWAGQDVASAPAPAGVVGAMTAMLATSPPADAR